MRAMARLFDAVVAMIFSLAVPGGAVLGAGYLLLSDGLNGQSLGKRLVGIKVVSWKKRRPAGRRASALRNWPLAVVALLVLVPDGGWSLVTTGGVLVVLVEGLRALRDPRGWRFGDVMAETQVIDASVPLLVEDVALERGGLSGVSGQAGATP